MRKQLLVVIATGLAIGVPVGVATAQEGAPAPAAEQEGYNRGDLPTVVVLEACEQVKLDGRTVPSSCDDLFAEQNTIREAAADLPPSAPTPEDYGLVEGKGE